MRRREPSDPCPSEQRAPACVARDGHRAAVPDRIPSRPVRTDAPRVGVGVHAGDFTPARAHLRKCCVARRVEECNLPVFAEINLIGADMLRDAARFACYHIGLTQRIEKTLVLLKKELELSRLQSEISKQVEDKMSANQRRYMLMEQLKHIKKELGLEKDDKEALAAKFSERIADKEVCTRSFN